MFNYPCHVAHLHACAQLRYLCIALFIRFPHKKPNYEYPKVLNFCLKKKSIRKTDGIKTFNTYIQ